MIKGIYFPEKGQALVELAVFGTILLFCLGMLINFGLQADYQQELEMKAFRQAMKQSYESENRGPNAGAEVHLIEDKPGISVQDPYGVSERYPFSASAKVTWNNNLMDEYVSAADQLQNGTGGTKDYRPKTSYNINAQEIGPYTTADFRNITCTGSITVRVPLLAPQGGKYWKDVTIDCSTQTKVFIDESSETEPKPLVGYIRNDAALPSGEKEQIGSVLIGGRQMTVVKVEGQIFKDPSTGEEYGGPIQNFWVVDTRAGEIDLAVEMAHKPDGTYDLAQYRDSRQGLLPDYGKTISKTGSFRKEETGGTITTTSGAFSEETIRRKIRLNKPDPVTGEYEKEIISEKLPYGRVVTWPTTR